MAEDRPAWARRMYNERQARGWSQADAIRAMRAHSEKELPGNASLLRQYKRWEAGEITPKEFYQPIIAATFGTVTHAMFPVAPRRDADADVLAVTGMDTLELVSRLQRSDLDQATLDGTADHGGPAVLGVPVHAQRPAPDRRPGVATPGCRLPGPAPDLEPAPRDPDPGGLDRVADRVRRIRLRRPPGRGDHAPGRAVASGPRPITARSRHGRMRSGPGST